MTYEYKTKGTCSQSIQFELVGNIIHNVRFFGGCNGNLKAISKLVEGQNADTIEKLLKGNTCGFRATSCADQLAIALRKAMDGADK